MKTSFTQKEVAEILEISPNTIQGWSRDGLIIPSVENPKGRGGTRLYSASDLTHIKIVSILSGFAYNRDVIKSLCNTIHGIKFITNLKETILDPYRNRPGQTIYIKRSDKKWQLGENTTTDIPKDSTTALIINVSKIMDEIKAKLKE